MNTDALQLDPLPGLAVAPRVHTHDPARDLVSARLHAERRWEPFETALLLACLRPGSVACDVGANIGCFALAFALAESRPRAVFAFEPAADNYALLRRNIELNDCASVVQAERAALGARDAELTLYRSADNRGDHHLLPGDDSRDTERVQQLRGDAYFAARGEQRIDVLKIDTQGTEMAVIEGLWQTLRASRGTLCLLVELTPLSLRRAGSSGRALVTRLAELDLPMAIADHLGRQVVPESPEALCRWCDNVDATPGDAGFMNIFAGAVPASFR